MNQQENRRYSFVKRTFWSAMLMMSLCASGAQAQTVLKGTVHDSSGEPLVGVTVVMNGNSKTATVTDIDGRYSVNVGPKQKADYLSFSYVGMKPANVKIGGKSVIDVTLQDDNTNLADVIVVGYGTARKESLTGAVAAMKGDELLKGPSTNVSSLLGGKLPGISSVQTSGEPGNDQASLRIRGSRMEALYIVDGMPRSINDIDPNDIESVSVLKDGAAAAVYGLNAAGGVIIVTTKKGAEGKAKVSYDGQYGLSVNANFPEFMNGPEFAHYYNMAEMMDQLANGTITSREDYVPHFTKKNVEAMLNDNPTDGWDNVNYIDKVFGTGHLMKHNLSVQGGTKALSYYVGGGYMNQKGNIDNFDYRRYNLRSNLNADLGRGWKMDLGLVGTITRKNQPRYNSGGSDGVGAGGETGWLSIGHQAVMMRPYLPEKWKGLYTGAIPNNNSIVYSPLAAIYESGYKKTRATEINSNFSISYDAPWLKGLSFKATGAYDYLSSRNKNLSTAYQTYAPNSAGQLIIYNDPEAVQQNQLAEGQYTTEQMVGQFSVAYARMFGKHNIDAMMLVEGRDFKSSSMAAYAEKIPFAGLPELSYGTPLAKNSQSGYSGHTRTAGYVFRLKYDYNNTYLAEFSGRYDGSYNFSGNVSSKRWGFFPSFSAAWRVSNEKFMESTKSWLSDFKLRASMGLLGNDAVSAYSFLSTYSFAGNRVFNGNIYSSLYTSSVANPELTWSKTRTSNLGFDLTLWDGKLGLEFDWFYNLNYDILASMAGDKAPSMGGYFHSVANHDRYANYGLEWTVSHRNKFQLAGKPFQYGASLNMTYAKSKWLRYLDQPNMQEWRKRVGTSVDACDVWIADGLFRSEEEIDNSAWYGSRPNVGDIKYRDINGDGKIDEQDRARIGRSNRPEIMMGLNLNASWNGFDLNMQFTGGFKFDVSMLGTYYNYCDDNTIWTQTFKEGANSPLWLVQDAYSIDNPNGKYPRITLSNVTHGGDNGLASTFWMRNGNYIRLKTAQLGYTLPKQWLRTINIERVRLFVEGSNLFTIDSLPTGIDPESPGVNNGYYPQQRTFLGGINITF